MSSEDVVSPPLNIEKCSLVLVDVAGTTTSIGFVKDTLFPFFLQHVEAFLREKWEEEAVKAAVKQLQEGDLEVAAAVTLLKSLTEEESPNPGLKALQGLVYKQAYEKGEIKAHVFEDVKDAFETWAKARRVAVYSTGSVDSQKMLFAHTEFGDLSGHIHKYYDLEVGAKTEAESYKKIVEDAEVEPQEVVFVTDDVKEATAAKSSGLHAVLIKREGNAALPENTPKDFTIISSFNELVLEKALKRKIEQEPTPSEAPPSKVPKTAEPAEEKEESAPSAKLEKIEEEMEVDDKAEEPKTATEETEKLVAKTETEIKEVEVETKKAEATCTDVEMKDEEKEAADSEAAAEEPAKKEEAKAQEAEAQAEDTQTEAETKTEEKTDKVEEKAAEEPKPEVEDTATKVEETKPVAEEKPEASVTEETKTEEAAQPEEAKAEEAKIEENGAAKEEAESSAPKAEEKENKSVLANGVENGKKEESEGAPEAAAEAKDEEKEEETEVKVKKLEESAESKTVSVEV